MTTLADIMLDVAEILGGVRSGTATAGTTSTLADTSRTEPADYWRDGTLFIQSGNSAGLATKILTFGENTFTINAVTAPKTLAAGNIYAAAPSKFPFDVIQIGIQRALDEIGDAISIDETLTVTASTNKYALPEGVSNIHRVEVATTTTLPYGYNINFFWNENNGYLYFEPSKAPTTVGMKIRLWYKASHAAVTDYSSIISQNINHELVKWTSVVNIYRDYLTRISKDDPIIIELLNQALVKEKELKDKRFKNSNYLLSIDPRFGKY